MPSTLTLLTLAATALATPSPFSNRQAASSEAFTSAASALIASYIPPAALSVLSASASSAASAAHVTGDPVSLIYSALEAPAWPPWFSSAVPAEYGAQISALTSVIGAMRPTPAVVTLGAPGPTSGGVVGGIGSASVDTSFSGGGGAETPTVGQTVVVVTSTDSAGGVVTSSYTSAVVVTAVTTSATGTTTGSSTGSGSSSSSSSGSSSATRTATSTSAPSGSTNAAAVVGPTGVVAGLVGLMGLVIAL